MREKKIRIASVRINNFRSIRNETIMPCDLNIFVGLNDAGKSNVLKALNLFFNGETDYGVKFSFDRDFTYLFPKASHAPKEIKITIKFDIPDTYTESGEYTWTKVWRIGDYFDETIVNSEGNAPNPKSRVPGALRRIKYRYVPAIKSREYFKTLLGDLYTAVFSSINNPLEESVNAFSKELRDYTQELSDEIVRQLQISSLLSFPDDLNDIFKALIFETSCNLEGVKVPLTARGDGIQVRHIPIVLRYIAHEDQKSRQRGSMKICTIWGFEEPENGLELSKTFQLADEFTEYAHEIQIFVSTHSPAFYMKKDTSTVNVFYVSKKANSDETSISSTIKEHSIAENMGLLPLVAPFIEEQSKRLAQAEKIYRENYLTDVPTILVEGETDVEYLKIAIGCHSALLNTMVESNQLRIICMNGNAAGVTRLADWILAWIYSGFKSKMYALFDKDVAGKNAKQEVESNDAYIKKQNGVSIKLQYLEPSDEIILLYSSSIQMEYEIEHLLSVDFWKEIKKHNYQEPRTAEELSRMFAKLLSRDKTLDNVIEDTVENVNIRDTILTFSPKELKKKKILDLLKQYSNQKNATAGMTQTIKKLEEYFCAS